MRDSRNVVGFCLQQALEAAAITAVVLACTTAANAVVVGGQSSGYGLSVDVILGPLPKLEVVDTPSISGIAPAPYVNNANLVNSNANKMHNLFMIGESTTGELDVNISSDVDGALGVRSASADSTVDDIHIDNLTQVLPLVPVTFDAVLDLNATQIMSTSDVTGDFGALIPTGTASLAGTAGAAINQASITVLGVEFLLLTNPAPNTSFNITPVEVLGLEGFITVIQNEQTLIGDGTTNQSISVNALRIIIGTGMIKLPPDQNDGVWGGEIIIGHSEAALQAEADPPGGGQSAPEPTTALLAIVGLFLLGGCRRSRPLHCSRI